jgi:hypothetical protein
MTKRERLECVIGGMAPDRAPVLGGWIANPGMLIKIARETEKAYANDPVRVGVKAYQALGMDGVIDIFTTKSADIYRCVDIDSYITADRGLTYEEAERKAEELPSPEEYEKQFKYEDEYLRYKNKLLTMQKMCGDMVYMPANWGAGGKASWYGDFGYENFFLLIGLRPDLGIKLFRLGGAIGRCLSGLTAKAANEGLIPKAVLLGEDICTQRGSMISVGFLEEYYAPALEYGLEPLLDAGCRPVWHSDGDVRALIPMLLKSGIQGFQGFQPECGMLIEELVNLRTRDGGKLLIFGPFAVTTELPAWSPEKIRRRVREVVEICEGKADLVFFTANTINPDVPLDNLIAMYDEIMKL